MTHPIDSKPSGRHRILSMLLGATTAAAVVGIAVMCSAPSVDRADPGDTARAFLSRYSTGDPQACELTTAKLRSKFDATGRCSRQVDRQEPTVEIFSAQPCGDKALVRASVSPSGDVGAPYALVGLDLVDEQWSVRSVRPINDRHVATTIPGPCRTTGGSP